MEKEMPMDKKLNCWEVKKCGRQPRGGNVREFGVCPAATYILADGVNCGEKGGRVCWSIAGTLCDGRIQGSFVDKQLCCMVCDFYKTVKQEEGRDRFRMMAPGVKAA